MDRIAKLREQYMGLKMVKDYGRDLYCYYIKVGSNLALYAKGWKEGADCLTLRQRHAYAESYVLKNTRPRIYEGELLTGSLDLDIEESFSKEEFETLKEEYFALIPQKQSRESHMGLDYTILLEKGISGILKDIENSDKDDIEAKEFYACLTLELEGVLALEENYKNEALRLYKLTGNKEYYELASVLENVPKNPAKSFREALESIHFFTFNLCGLYSMGRVDEYLYPYYKNDIEKGIITKEYAQELIDCFNLLYIPNIMQWTAAGYMLGGTDKNGKLIENELTEMFLKAIEHTCIPDPNVGLVLNENTSDKILQLASSLIGNGYTNPAVWNDRAVVEGLVARGFKREHAVNFTNSTCVELTPVGCSGISVTSPYVNILKIFLDAFYNTDDGADYNALVLSFKNELTRVLEAAVYNENLRLLENRRNGNTNPIRISALINDCVKRGRSVDQGGALYYGLEADFLGLSNVIESFNVIRQLVYDKKEISLSELKKAVKNNFSDEGILEKIQGVSHFGNDEDSVNTTAQEIAELVRSVCSKFKCINNVPLAAGAFSYNNHIPYGKETCASPDGRKDGEPLNNGSNPALGYDISGPTAMLNSLNALIPNKFTGGFTVNMNLPKTVKDSIFYLLKSFICLDIPQLQFNVLDKKDLLDAKEHPEKYKNLIVRVGGYSDYFINLTPELQQEVISRYE
jgi:formate C-acetyltransferase